MGFNSGFKGLMSVSDTLTAHSKLCSTSQIKQTGHRGIQPEFTGQRKKMLPAFSYMEAKIWTLRRKWQKLLASVEMKFFIEQPDTLLLTTKGMQKFWKS